MSTVEHFTSADLRAFRREEYDRLVGLGLFEGEKVELLEGMIVRRSAEGPRHAHVVARLMRLLGHVLPADYEFSVHTPFAASDLSEPEPDLFVFPPGDYLDDHPSEALLVIEVAASSLKTDRGVKSRIYAASGVPEYWVVNLAEGLVEVFEEPSEAGYARARIARHGDVLRPTGIPGLELPIELFLP